MEIQPSWEGTRQSPLLSEFYTIKLTVPVYLLIHINKFLLYDLYREKYFINPVNSHTAGKYYFLFCDFVIIINYLKSLNH